MAIVLEKQSEYDRAAIKERVFAALTAFAGVDRVLSNRSRILLKPNSVVPETAFAACTSRGRAAAECIR